MSRIISTVAEWRALRASGAFAGKSVGFVPTMGALHEGHASLLARSRQENEVSVLSVFVNPTQFNDPTDLEKYPRTLERDVALADRSGVDFIFTPAFEAMYPDGYRYKMTENELSRELCGKHRPGHFDGVLTVVLKLLNLVKPDRAYFGEKDFQQLELVRGMIEALFMDCQIVPMPTVREADGLAMSSRNARLTPGQREQAPQLARVLREVATAAQAEAKLNAAGFEVDYVEDRLHRRIAAARLGEVRLIDNLAWPLPECSS